MKKLTLKGNKKGFTIIEVLIVLAIAGLIMVVVFLAVPALQRNQRNTSRKTEANNILSAVSEVQGNKNGAAIVVGDQDTITGNVKLNQYAPNSDGSSNVTVVTTTSDQPTKDKVYILPGFACSATDPTATPTSSTSSTRSVAVWYAVESGTSGKTNQCIGTGQ